MQIIAVIVGTFVICFITSLILEIKITRTHWIREVLVILFIFLELFIGTIMVFEIAKKIKK